MHDLVSDRNERSRLIENALAVDVCTDEVKKRAKRPTLRRALVVDVVDAAMAHARATGAADMDSIVGPAFDIVDSLQAGLTPRSYSIESDPDPPSKWDFWRHEDHPLQVIESGKAPYISRDSIEGAASEYLKLPYRAPLLERTLVDVLIAREVYTFGTEVGVRKPKFILRLLPMPLRPPLQQRHTLLGYLTGELWSAAVLLGLAYLSATYLPAAIGGWVAGGLVALFVVMLALDTIFLPWRWWESAQVARQAGRNDPTDGSTYKELPPGVAVSTRRLREVVNKAADAGVVWPSPLYAMLDDNIGRTGRL